MTEHDGSDHDVSHHPGTVPEALVHAVARLARAATGEFTVDAMLRELCEAAGAALAVDSVGVMGVSDGDGLRRRGRFVHSDTSTFEVEMLQDTLQLGPCRDAMDSGAPVVITDLRIQRGRWDDFTVAALASQMAAVVALPLRSRGVSWGSLDLYRREPGEWEQSILTAASLLADVAVSYLVMAHDRDQARASQRELEHRSMHDQLTGLPNRGLLYDRIEHALLTARRRSATIALVFIDLDRFKNINDTFGHGAGDQVLTEVTRRMYATLRSGDTLGRLAGDEFVLLCEELPSDATQLHRTLTLITSRLRAALAQPVRVDGIDLLVSASIGVTTAHDAPDADALLHDADTAMYAAKEAGRGRVIIRDHVFGDVHGFGRRLERDLASALEGRQLRLHYQPIIDARTGRIEAVEALLRWQHPEFGLLPAIDFIDRAEASGLLPRLGHWVVETACAQLAVWRRDLDGRAPQRVFCNVRPRELSDPDTLTALTASLAVHGLQPGDLGLEILEEAFSDPLLLSALGTYSAQGHPIAVDDFGTGYSSLSRLVGFPVAYAKIDRSFVAGLPEDTRSRALVDAVLVVAAGLDLRVIGEGVETEEQRAYLTGAGVHLLQGYHLGRPQPTGAISVLLGGTKPETTG
ncbi:EAL domain-containing protein [Kineococcus sp. NPDC059986]|jgi:diguanylate cyclase (GGDEF)-like protein|uniref:putative bifunctional diguanylate cyclase/phosphodiesterase n=1 Tax=Kineococcus sp. NPDC059986 TaxID=3155538 RepID=UPI00344ED73D